MKSKLSSLLLLIPVFVLVIILQALGVLDVDEQAFGTENAADVSQAIEVDTTASPVAEPTLREILVPDEEHDSAEARAAWVRTLTFHPVVRTVDGDTIIISVDGVDERVRMIGVDTPETVHPNKAVECYGKEASAYTAAMVGAAGAVALEVDPTQDERDRYGRLLGYVILPDGRNLNALIIYEGYGYEYTYRTPYEYQAEFTLAQAQAEGAARGLWAPGACEE